MSVCKAAKVYKIPESTLRDRTRGNVKVDAKNGVPPLLAQHEEQELVKHLKHMADIGYRYSRSDIKLMARNFAVSLGKPVKSQKCMSNTWFFDFLKRWPEVQEVRLLQPHLSKATSVAKDTVTKYYTKLNSILMSNSLLDRPERIFSIGETKVSTEHTPSEIVLGETSDAQPGTSSASSSDIVIIASGNAQGNHVPPYYIFPGKRWSGELLRGAAEGSAGEMAKADSTVFANYLKTHFSKYAGLSSDKDGPKTLVLFDGQQSHVVLTLTEWAKQHNVILFVLPPHSSHLTQPLKVGVFGPFKHMLLDECLSFVQENPGIAITKKDIAQLTARPYTQAFCRENLTSAFCKAGIYPSSSEVVSTE